MKDKKKKLKLSIEAEFDYMLELLSAISGKPKEWIAEGCLAAGINVITAEYESEIRTQVAAQQMIADIQTELAKEDE